MTEQYVKEQGPCVSAAETKFAVKETQNKKHKMTIQLSEVRAAPGLLDTKR